MRQILAVVDRWRFFGSLAVSVVLVLPFLGLLRGQDAGRRDGLIITIPNPIKGDTADAVRSKILDAAVRQKRVLDTIVFDFNPDELPASTLSFGGCLELADLIRKLQLGEPPLPRVQTVAYVHKAATDHTVLPVLACGQIIFGPDGSLGGVPQDSLSQTQRTAYREQTKYHAAPDVAMRVVDPDLVLRRVKTAQGSRLVSQATLDEWRRQGKDVSVLPGEPPRGLEPGKALIDAETARESGLAQAILGSRGEVVESLGLSRRSLNEDWLVDRIPVAWRIELRGPVDAGKLQSLERRIKFAVGRGANFLILQLDSPGGDARHVAAVAKEIQTLKDNTGAQPVRTVAWVPPNVSLGASTFLAVGCNEIVMGSDSALADFGYLSPDDRKPVAQMLNPLVKSQGYPPLLFDACLETMGLVRVKSRADTSALPQLVTMTDFAIDQKSPLPRWNSFGMLMPGEGRSMLKITPALAREWQIATATDVDSVDALYRTLGLTADKVRVSRDDALDHVAEFFREPWVNFLLIMVGIIGLILEVKLPGTTVPGTVAAICFVLFFWAYSFVGEFTLLAVFLFLLGLVMLAIEVFVVPGVTFVGLAGLVLVIVSLGLVTLDHFPTTPAEWLSLGSTLTTFGLSLVAAAVGAVCLTYYLPSIPYANRLVLKPPEEQPVTPPAARAPLGAIGVTVTTLRPAGKVQFGDEFVDVVAEGSYVEPGTRVQIIEIEGNRVVVKEI